MGINREKLLSVAREAKEALYGEWEKKRYFTDYNNFFGMEQGLLSEAMGLTGTMLMFVAFCKEEGVFPDGTNDRRTQEIIHSSLNYIYDTVMQEGYTVSPLRSAQDTKEFFNERHSYTDTLTWVLSASSLTIYAIRNKLLDLDEQMQDKAISLISDSLARILDGQLDCGAWGFSTDHGCKPSLYFTYTVATSLADFLDYILGELVYYSTEDYQDKDPTDFYDWETVNAINDYYKKNPKPFYPQDELTKAVAKAKASLQGWLLHNCLPLLPKIAACTPLSAEERNSIGIVQQTSETNIQSWDNKDYIQLYYAYYIIDILTTSSSDQRFLSIVKKQDPEITVDSLRQAYRGKIPTTDMDYFFGRSGKVTDFFRDYIDQAIHSVRFNFSIASRTGSNFWTGSKSELIIPWEHTSLSPDAIAACRGEYNPDAGEQDPFTEPALVPMALRANTIYCFYIIEQADITVDNLFDIICDDRSPKSENTRQGNRVRNLWDRMSYNLAISERAIESLVDYADYLDKIEDQSAKISSAAVGITSIDEAINQRIADYFHSEDANASIRSMGYVPAAEHSAPAMDEDALSQLIDQRINALLDTKLDAIIAQKLSAAVPSGVPVRQDSALVKEQIFSAISDVLRWYSMQSEALPQLEVSDASEKLAAALVELHAYTGKTQLVKCISEHTTKNPEEAFAFWNDTLSRQLIELLKDIVAECSTAAGNLPAMYRKNRLSD